MLGTEISIRNSTLSIHSYKQEHEITQQKMERNLNSRPETSRKFFLWFFFSNASKIDRFRAFSLPRIMWRWHRKCYSFCDMLIRLKYLKECAGQKGCVSKIHVLSWNCGFCPALAEEGKMPPRMPQQHIYVAPKVHSVFLGCTERRLTPSGLVPQWGCLLSVMQHQEHVRCLSKVGEESRFPASVMHVTKDQCF